MKKVLSLALVLAVGCIAPLGAIAGEGHDHGTAWFDMEKCAMCTNLMATEGMIDALGWEHHLVSNGMMTVTVVPAKYAEAWSNTRAAMASTGEKLKAGEQLELCGFCQSFMGFMAGGKTNVEEFETIGGEISLVTSSDPATVKAIQAHAKRTMKELEKMAAATEKQSR